MGGFVPAICAFLNFTPFMKNPFIVFLLGLLFAWSCNEIEECQLDPYSEQVVFLLRPEIPGTILSFDSASMDGFGILGRGENLQNLTAFALPVDFLTNQVTYRFYTDSVAYFITLDYLSESMVYELICEPTTRIFGLSINDTNFPLAEINIPELDKRVTLPNVEITI